VTGVEEAALALLTSPDAPSAVRAAAVRDATAARDLKALAGLAASARPDEYEWFRGHPLAPTRLAWVKTCGAHPDRLAGMATGEVDPGVRIELAAVVGLPGVDYDALAAPAGPPSPADLEVATRLVQNPTVAPHSRAEAAAVEALLHASLVGPLLNVQAWRPHLDSRLLEACRDPLSLHERDVRAVLTALWSQAADRLVSLNALEELLAHWPAVVAARLTDWVDRGAPVAELRLVRAQMARTGPRNFLARELASYLSGLHGDFSALDGDTAREEFEMALLLAVRLDHPGLVEALAANPAVGPATVVRVAKYALGSRVTAQLVDPAAQIQLLDLRPDWASALIAAAWVRRQRWMFSASAPGPAVEAACLVYEVDGAVTVPVPVLPRSVTSRLDQVDSSLVDRWAGCTPLRAAVANPDLTARYLTAHLGDSPSAWSLALTRLYSKAPQGTLADLTVQVRAATL